MIFLVSVSACPLNSLQIWGSKNHRFSHVKSRFGIQNNINYPANHVNSQYHYSKSIFCQQHKNTCFARSLSLHAYSILSKFCVKVHQTGIVYITLLSHLALTNHVHIYIHIQTINDLIYKLHSSIYKLHRLIYKLCHLIYKLQHLIQKNKFAFL